MESNDIRKATNLENDFKSTKIFTEVTVVGKDKKGIVADITRHIFKNGGNIEKINQNVVKGLFGMHLEASFYNIDKTKMKEELGQLSKHMDMEIKVHFREENKIKNVAIFVSREGHCLLEILDSVSKGKAISNISIIIASDEKLKDIADSYSIPFFYIEHTDQNKAEDKILQLLEQFNIDLIVLARYMRILSPNFVWRYPNRIINIHPSLLPAFPGALAYAQAYERGAKIIGCTAHFVTDDLDQGPIICQDAFKVSESDTLDTIKTKGRDLEATTLLNAIKLYLEGRLEVYWGKVITKSHT